MEAHHAFGKWDSQSGNDHGDGAHKFMIYMTTMM